MDATSLDIRLAVPDDAIALASTTRLGFESYLAWAPEGWQPPPRSLEIRAIRERLRAPARAHPRARAPVDAVRAASVVGHRARRAPAPAGARGGDAPGVRHDPALHAARGGASARVLRT